MHAAEIGLSVGDFFGEGYIIGFRQGGGTPRARFVPGYKGLLKLAYQSNLVAAVDAYVIYEKDRFEADLGKDTDPITYKPYLGLDHPGAVIAAYTRIKLSNGAVKHDLMPVWKLELVRKGSPGARDASHPWNTSTDEMYRKTGIRHALKDAPKSNELDRAIRLDEASESDEAFVTDNMTFPGEEPRQMQEGRAAESRNRVKAQAAQLPAKAQPVINTQGEPVRAAAPAKPAQAPAAAPAAVAPQQQLPVQPPAPPPPPVVAAPASPPPPVVAAPAGPPDDRFSDASDPEVPEDMFT